MSQENGLDKKRTSLAGAGGFTVGLFQDAVVKWRCLE